MRRGISLIELVVCLSIVAILLAVGVPAFRQHQVSQTQRTAADQLLSALKLLHSGRIAALLDPRASLTDLGALHTLPGGGTSSGGSAFPQSATFQMQQLNSGTVTEGPATSLDSAIHMSVSALEIQSVPSTCSALVVHLLGGTSQAIVFFPNGQLFRGVPPIQQAQISLSAANVPTINITVSAAGSITLAQAP